MVIIKNSRVHITRAEVPVQSPPSSDAAVTNQKAGVTSTMKTLQTTKIQASDFIGSALLVRAGRDEIVLVVLQRCDLRVVEVERRRLRADPRDRDEVVARRRAGGRPLQRSAPTPGVVD